MIEYENLYRVNKHFREELSRTFNEVLDDGKFILGKHVNEFENQFAQYTGARYCVGVGNGHDALVLALRSFSFERNAEVIVPANTYVATILAILNSGLKPVLVEPDIENYTIDPKRIEEAISKRTVALMVVHLYGKCCAMDEIMDLSNKYDLKVIEDCAQSHGAKFKSMKAGTFGDFGAFSFYPTKNLGAFGDGGCIITDHEELKNEIELLRNYGSRSKNETERVGINSRLDELQAAFLSVKLRSLDAINEHKRTLAAIYSYGLKEDFIKPMIHSDYFDVYHIYNVRHPRRDKLREYLLKNDIQTEIHYPTPSHQQLALRQMFESAVYPITEEIHSTTLSLPISFAHEENDIRQVVEVMNRF